MKRITRYLVLITLLITITVLTLSFKKVEANYRDDFFHVQVLEITRKLPILPPPPNVVHGSVLWKDDHGNLYPLQNVKVEIIDQDLSGYDDVLTTLFTDDYGNYGYQFDNNDVDESNSR